MGERRNRLGLGLLDQILSGGSNVVATFAIARVSSVEEFGAAGLAIVLVMSGVIFSRGFVGTPLTLLSGDTRRLRKETPFALTLSVVVGSVVGVGLASTAAFSPHPELIFLVACAAPWVVMQDAARFSCISAGRPGLAVVSDGLWACGSAVLFGVTLLNPEIGVEQILAGWVASSAVAAVVILSLLRSGPKVSGFRVWIAHGGGDRARYGAEAAISALNGFLFLAVAGVLVGTSAVATLRGAGSVMAPLNMLLAALPLLMVSELGRRDSSLRGRPWPAMRRVAVLMSTAALAVGVLSLFIPAAWGEFLLGATWEASQPLLIVTGVEYVGLSWGIAAQAILRLQADSRSVLAVRVVHSGLLLVLTSIAAAYFGTPMAIAVSLAVAALLSAIFAVARSVQN